MQKGSMLVGSPSIKHLESDYLELVASDLF